RATGPPWGSRPSRHRTGGATGPRNGRPRRMAAGRAERCLHQQLWRVVVAGQPQLSTVSCATNVGGRRGRSSAYAASVARAHFRIFGTPIRVEPFFVVVAALFGIRLEPLWVVFAWVGIVFVSVLVHELGHALTYRALGQR